MSSREIGLICILIGAIVLLVLWVVLHERRVLHNLVIGLSRVGPATAQELVESGYAKRHTVLADLSVLAKRGLVSVREPFKLSPLVYRLTTEGWSFVNSLR